MYGRVDKASAFTWRGCHYLKSWPTGQYSEQSYTAALCGRRTTPRVRFCSFCSYLNGLNEYRKLKDAYWPTLTFLLNKCGSQVHNCQLGYPVRTVLSQMLIDGWPSACSRLTCFLRADVGGNAADQGAAVFNSKAQETAVIL